MTTHDNQSNEPLITLPDVSNEFSLLFGQVLLAKLAAEKNLVRCQERIEALEFEVMKLKAELNQVQGAMEEPYTLSQDAAALAAAGRKVLHPVPESTKPPEGG